MSDDKVLQFPGGGELPEQTILIERDQHRYCNHEKISLDPHARAVICVICGATLDPFDFLVKNGITLQRAWSDHKSVKAKISELMGRVMFLKKQKASLEASVRRLKDKVPVLDTRGKDIL